MNLLHCPRCGKALPPAEPGSEPRCPECEAAALRYEEGLTGPPTVSIREGQPAADTDPGAEENQRTINLSHQPGLSTGGPDRSGAGKFGPEYYDFLSPPERPDELGRLGPYRILRVLGAGGMGVVYEADEPLLERRVALKVLLPALAVSASSRQRFLREARTAAKIEHERIVAIFQVGEERGIPYLAMPLLKGESLDARLHREGRQPVAEVLRIGREVADALAAAHDRGMVHRDIKPGNIWLEGAACKVKLLDFGLARSLERDNMPITQQGSLVGTPAFMSPEQAAGQEVDARCDLFSLGCVLYHVSTGTLPFQGANAVSTLMAVMNRQPLAPLDIYPGLPPALSALIMRLLAKRPADRFSSARAVIEALGAVDPSTAVQPVAPTPTLRVSGPVEIQQTMTAAPTAIIPPDVTTSEVPTPVVPPTSMPPTSVPPTSMPPTSVPRNPRRWPLYAGIAGIGLLLAGGVFLLPPIISRLGGPGGGAGDTIEIGIAFGTEKEKWFNEAVRDFAATPEGKNITIQLIPMGSLEGGQAVSAKEDKRIHVWSPASSLYKQNFVRDWQRKHPGHEPIAHEASLALTPMVFVFWKDRYDLFVAKYKKVSFPTIIQAIEEKQGWEGIGGKPEWGMFRFGHTNPTQSNSGLMTLLLIACEFNGGKLPTAADLAGSDLGASLARLERGVAGMPHSTGTLMNDMVTKGPSAYDAIFVYESVALDYLKAARGRWGDLHVTYPRVNHWSGNPYYILDVPWSSKEQRQAAQAFLTFLLSEPMQKRALQHGFRPANLDVPIREADSPFVRYQDSGVSVDVGTVCPPPSKEIIDELLQLWERSK